MNKEILEKANRIDNAINNINRQLKTLHSHENLYLCEERYGGYNRIMMIGEDVIEPIRTRLIKEKAVLEKELEEL